MNKKLFLASILTPEEDGQWTFYRQGALLIEDGRIVNVGDATESHAARSMGDEVIQLDGVIIPGFVDLHCHWVQHAVRGAYGGDLLHWLQNDIWPEESRYVDATFARERARAFYQDLLRAGTVMGMSYSSVHRTATEIAVEEMLGDWTVGNVLMAVNAPDALTRCSMHQESALRDFASLQASGQYAVTPRFAPNMLAEDLAIAGRVAQEGNYLVQTHLAESRSEIAWVKELFPEAANYTDVYDHAGLLGPKSILGHCIEMSDAEWACLARRGSWVAHCPTSNEALGNARMPLEKLREFGVPYALASDIGGGPSHSMLHVMQRFMAVHSEAGVPVTVQETLYRATLAGARAMGRGQVAGNLAPGKRADFVLLPGNPKAVELEGWFADLCQGTIKELEERPIATYLAGQEAQTHKGRSTEFASDGEDFSETHAGVEMQ
ncbi:amidohydrolase family protein [Acidithiobacillus ferrooxidans]|uniref:amidohydrolase family protein n=1 Tax=Acidithiobacillus ferrooxidans TaxID=920 RepID=UPI001C0753CB|nr:amidohydrolase family protein [Acidithiobacillus ferrooxidans]MBU2774829.1 amidohydrolase family protein [Acidithiobacillus ferrooxidans]